MNSLDLTIISSVVAAASGLPGLWAGRSRGGGQRVAAAMVVIAAFLGLCAGGGAMLGGQSPSSALPWPAAGKPIIGMDSLSAFFLVPVFLMSGLGPVYGLGYWPQSRHTGNGRKVRLFWGLLTAGMTLLVVSRHAMAFLLGWELMAISAFFLISTEDHRAECRRAAWIYFIATHISTLTLFAMFALWRVATGSYVLRPVSIDAIDVNAMNALFFLALVGFGLKAGIMPLHFWLPGAHANAPSHVSAMLSGVVIKMGVYGLVRFLSLLPAPPSAWGGLLLGLGAVSGLLGVVFAISQHDLKRLLAYHSVENIGIILMGLGVATMGRSIGRPEWIVLGLAGCLLHVWNHSLFKSLLFLGAGAVVHGTHTRRIDHLGGLAAAMPWTATLFLTGAVAICGLPPLNGFVSELFLYLGLLRAGTSNSAGVTGGAAAMVVVPVLAMIGALALACFVKVFGAVFLGTSRTRASAGAHEAPFTMLAPMVVLAALCAVIGLAPVLVGPVLDAVIAGWAPDSDSVLPELATVAPLKAISLFSASLVTCIAVLAVVLGRAAHVTRRVNTWDCGYAGPTSRMQYTASSFARMVMGMFWWILAPRVHRPRLDGPFPNPTAMSSHVDDAVLDRWLVPLAGRIERCCAWFRRFQQGLTQHYMLYIVLTVILMLSTLIPFDRFMARLFAR